MLHNHIKNILIDKLKSKFICFMIYNDGVDTFEKPFKFSSVKNSQLSLLNCVTNKLENLKIDSIVNFKILHDENLDDSNKLSNEIINLYQKNSTIYDFINGDKYYSLVFNIKCVENKNIIPVLNCLRSTDINDYEKFNNNDLDILIVIKQRIKSEILKRYDEVISSLDEEYNKTTDQSIKDEINAIKNVLLSIPGEVEVELESKVKYDDIITYWPTLLLPRVNLKFPVFIPDFGFEFN